MPRARADVDSERVDSPLCVRVGRLRRSAWEAALVPGESLSSLVRDAVEVEVERRRQERELETTRQATDPLAKLLARYQR